VPIDDAILTAAEAVTPGTVATLDAIRLTIALEPGAAGHITTPMTLDERLAAGAREHGLGVLAPS